MLGRVERRLSFHSCVGPQGFLSESSSHSRYSFRCATPEERDVVDKGRQTLWMSLQWNGKAEPQLIGDHSWKNR